MRFFKTPNFVVKCATSAQLADLRQEHPVAVEIESHLVDREHVWQKIYYGIPQYRHVRDTVPAPGERIR